MAEVKLKAKKRESSTKGALNQMRKEGFVPGIFYKKDEKNIPIFVHETEINPLVFTSESHLIVLDVEGENNGVHDSVLKDVQFDPVTDKVVHFDLRGITRGEVVVMEVPLSLHGNAVGVKEGGVLQQSLHKLEIECLPSRIPERLEFDISNLELGATLQVKDLKLEDIKILNQEDAIVASVVAQRASDSEEQEESSEEGPEVINGPEEN
jgi:large subunit ribosomal protein L25